MNGIKYKIFVINMARSVERWAAVSAQLDNLDMPYERIEGVDASKLSTEELAQYYSFAKNKKQYPRPLKIGEIGCYISHVKCWDMIARQHLDFGIVLEDDIVISGKFPKAVDFLKNHFSDWDFVRLQSETKNRILYGESEFDEFNLREFIRTSGATWGYAVNYRAAECMRAKCVPFGITVDSNMHFYHRFNIKTLSLYPPVIYEGKSASCINTGGANPKNFGFLSRPLFSFNCYIEKLLYLQKRDIFSGFLKKIWRAKIVKAFDGNTEFNALYCSNEKYAKFAAVSIVSLLKNNPRYIVKIHLFESDFSETTKEVLVNAVKSFKNASISFYKIDSSTFASFKPQISYISEEGFFRYLAADLIKGPEKVLYLDCDTVVNADIGDVFKTDLGENYCAAVADKYVMKHGLHRDLGLADNYFNSGVLLFNLPRIRETGTVGALFDITKNRRLRFGDQDAINIVFNGHIKELPYAYNNCSKSAWRAKIIHFIGPKKPWNSREFSARKFKYVKFENVLNSIINNHFERGQ